MSLPSFAPLAITLLASLACTVLFSLSATPGIRGYRNLGILACYLGPFVFLFLANWKVVLVTWMFFGVAGGLIYTLWEILQRLKTTAADKPKVSLGHVFPGLIAWPIMIPEALEYSLAELGILKPAPKPDPTPAP